MSAPPSANDWLSPMALHAAWLHLQARISERALDRDDIEAIAADPIARCALLSHAVASGSHRPSPLRPVDIPKRSGGSRQLLIPSIADRIVHSALAHWMSQQIDGRLLASSHAYRAGRGVATAAAQVQAALDRGHLWVWRADIDAFFDNVDHARLMAALRSFELWAHRLAAVLRQFLRSEVQPPPRLAATSRAPYCICRGLPQGSPLSPVLSNIYLHALDAAMEASGCSYVRYADDLVVLADSPLAIDAAVATASKALTALGLVANAGKSRFHLPGEAFEFLGRHFDPAATPTIGDAPPLDPVETRAEADNAAAPVSAATGDAAVQTQTHDHAAPLLRTVYLLENDGHLGREGDALLVQAQGLPDRRVPAARVHQVLAFGATHLSSGAIALCLEQRIPVMLLSGRGRHFGVIDPLGPPRIGLLNAQLSAADDSTLCLRVAQELIRAKLANSLLMLRRWHRRHRKPQLHDAILRLADARNRVGRMSDLDALRGLEGAGAAAYFAAMASLLPEEWKFLRRRRQPPPDPVNAMLSYGYTLLYYNTLTLVLARGLQPHVGMLHAARAGHHALVSDLMEPFRPIVVDSIVMDLALNGGVRPAHFNWPEQEGEGCLMDKESRNRLIHAFESKMNTRIENPAMGGLRLDLRRWIDLQTMQLADHLEGRAARFEAFVAR